MLVTIYAVRVCIEINTILCIIQEERMGSVTATINCIRVDVLCAKCARIYLFLLFLMFNCCCYSYW